MVKIAFLVVFLAAACNGGWQADYRYKASIGATCVYTSYVPYIERGSVYFNNGVLDPKCNGKGESFKKISIPIDEHTYKLEDRGQK